MYLGGILVCQSCFGSLWGYLGVQSRVVKADFLKAVREAVAQRLIMPSQMEV